MPDVYSIMMSVGIDDKATAGLRNITESMSKLVEALDKAHQGFGLLAASLTAGAGLGILLGLTKMAEAANDYTDALARMRIAHQDTARAVASAQFVTGQRPGTTYEENLARLQMMRRFLGPNVTDAQLLAATKAEEMFGLYGIQGGVEATLRGAQALGYTRPGYENQLNRFLESRVKIAQATGVSPQQLDQVISRAGLAGMRMDPEMQNVILPFLISGGLGGRMGPGGAIANLESGALASLRQRGRGGQIDRLSLQQFYGRQLGTADIDAIATNPYEWAQQMYGRLQQRGMFAGARTPQEEDARIQEQMQRIFRNPQTANLMAQFMMMGAARLGTQSPFYQAQQQYAAAGGTSPEAMGIFDARTAAKMKEVGDTFHNLMTDIASADAPLFNAVLDSLTSFLKSVDNFVKNTPAETIQAITIAIGTLAGGMVALGAVGVLGMFGAAGPIAIAVAGLGAAILLIAGIKWAEARINLDNIYDMIFKWVARVQGIKLPPDPDQQRTAPLPNIPQGSALDRILKGFQFWTGIGVPGGDPNNAMRPSRPIPFLETDPTSRTFRTGVAEQKPQTVTLTLNIDGQTISTAIWNSMMLYNQFPIGAAGANANTNWPSPDQTYIPR